MTVSVSSPVTGAAQTGFTNPTYTLVSDTPPQDQPAKQWAVTALGGTQSGVDTHAASKPFTITFTRPRSMRSAPTVNLAGAIGNAPRNTFSVIVRKGATPVTGQAPQVAVLRADLSVPAGTDVVEPEDIRAALSLLIGSMNQVSAGLGDTLVTGLL